jgi:hypothetical protein
MQASAGNYAAGTRAFAHAVRTLQFSFADEPVEPDPALMPRLDPLTVERGEGVEDLSGISAAQERAGEEELEPLDGRHIGAPERRLLIEVHEQGRAEPVSVVVPQRLDARPVALARLLHVAPAWIFGFSENDRSGLIDAAMFEARLRDPSTPPPDGANDGLVRIWGSYWRLVTIDGRSDNGILVTEGTGAIASNTKTAPCGSRRR